MGRSTKQKKAKRNIDKQVIAAHPVEREAAGGMFDIFRREHLPTLPALLLGVSSCVFAILFFVALTATYTDRERAEWHVYVASSVLLPAVALISIAATARIRERWFADNEMFWPTLLFLRYLAAAAMVILAIRFLLWPFFMVFPIMVPPLINLAAFFIARAANAKLKNRIKIFSTYFVYASIPVIAMLTLLAAIQFRVLGINAVSTIYFLLAGGALCAGIIYQPFFDRIKLPKIAVTSLYALMIMLIFALTYLPSYPFDLYHHLFWFGPINDLLCGKTMLVDTDCQYGVLNIVTYAAVFKSGLIPFTNRGMSMLNDIAFIGQFLILFFILHQLLRSRLFAFIGMSLIIFLYWLGHPLGMIVGNPLASPLRFGMPYLMLFSVSLRIRFPRAEKALRIAESVLMGVASLWSFETFIYMGAAYVGISLPEILRSNRWERLRACWRRLAPALLAIVCAHFIFGIATLIRGGAWPDWSHYLDYFLAFNRVGWPIPVDPWSPFIIVALVYLVSIAALSLQMATRRPLLGSADMGLAMGFSLFGLALFSYYIGRSHISNLYIIAIPAIVLGVFWLRQLFEMKRHVAFRLSVATCVALIIGLSVNLFLPTVRERFQMTLLSALFNRRHNPSLAQQLEAPWYPEQYPEESKFAAELMDKYAPKSKRVTVLMRSDLNTLALLCAKRTNTYPICHPEEVSNYVTPANIDSRLAFSPPLKTGDILIINSNKAVLLPYQQYLLGKIGEKFVGNTLEEGKGVTAFQLMPK